MKNIYAWILIPSIIIATASLSRAQQGVAINTTGNTNETGAILDLSNQNINGALGFLPPYVTLTNATTLTPPITGGTSANLSGLLVYNTNPSVAGGLSGPGLYYWSNSSSKWIYLTSGGVVTNANNGTSYVGPVQLGGSNLIQATNIPLNTYPLSITGSSVTTTFAASGQVGIGNAVPNAKAILDLTNAADLGLMLPGMATASLPAVTAAQNGLIVYNTLGCAEYVSGGAWTYIGPHGSATFNYTGASQSFTVPACVSSVTITVVAGGGGNGNSFITGFAAYPGEVTATFNPAIVTAGTVLTLYVGGAGGDATGIAGGTAGINGSADGAGGVGFGDAGGTYFGGGGGAASEVFIGATQVIVAGGEGGGGACGFVIGSTRGGDGGPATATNSTGAQAGQVGGLSASFPNSEGQGGAVAAGGAAAGYNPIPCVIHGLTAGTTFPVGTGGHGGWVSNVSGCTGTGYGGGGGGGGYTGGGGGDALGGGGGSSYVLAADISGNATYQPYATSSNSNGFITITW